MSADPGGPGHDRSPWTGIRTIIVPPDIVAVRRQSPLRVKTRTPWRPRPDAEPTERGGSRNWFDDHIFTDSHQPQIRAACSTSMTVHVSCVMAVLACF